MTFIPAIFKICSDIKTGKGRSFDWKTIVAMALDVISSIFIIVGIVVWPVLNSTYSETSYDLTNAWAFPVGAFLTSFGWWESFVSENSKIPPIRYLWRIKTKMTEGKSRCLYVIRNIVVEDPRPTAAQFKICMEGRELNLPSTFYHEDGSDWAFVHREG